MKSRFKTILVANRGEIALRIMRTIKKKGMKCVAVYSSADADSPHVKYADQAICIGSGSAQDSYLSIQKILDAANFANADAIHPGYGFLSENPKFAEAVEKNEIKFIGPSPKAIEAMGNKAKAKNRMIKAGVPCIPGYQKPNQSDKVLLDAAKKIGFPIMVKAASGGGGRGMRLSLTKNTLLNNINLARSEALNSFGSSELILEKALVNPRHIEVQIFGDSFGNIIHFGERDCSVQRRYQKVIEEAPSPAVNESLRKLMGQAAINAAKAIKYEGAGTVEFLLDQEGNFYFLEMNTRLQVEHPVTEMVTGLDLVALQIDVAQGMELNISQDDVVISGHSMEVRLYAEDPLNDFLPSSGKILFWNEPYLKGLRVDSGIVKGQTLPSFYDPMLAKLISHGENREEARKILVSGLQSAPVLGLRTNRDHLINLLQHANFINCSATTSFISESFGKTGHKKQIEAINPIFIAAALLHCDNQEKLYNLSSIANKKLLGWGSPGFLRSRLKLKFENEVYILLVKHLQNGRILIVNGDESKEILLENNQLWVDGLLIDLMAYVRKNKIIYFALTNNIFEVSEVDSKPTGDRTDGGSKVLAPMHGSLIEIYVSREDSVLKGDRLAVLEAMKMQHELIAENDGTISAVNYSVGDQVRANDLLLELKPTGKEK